MLLQIELNFYVVLDVLVVANIWTYLSKFSIFNRLLVYRYLYIINTFLCTLFPKIQWIHRTLYTKTYIFI